MYKIDLNSDLGESFGRYTLGMDNRIIPLISSANVACGYHASDPVVMEKTVAMAKEAGIGIGAHPGYPDLMGFGRRNLDVTPAEARAYTLYQLGALDGFCRANGVKMQHVKPHGALYNMAGKDYALAKGKHYTREEFISMYLTSVNDLDVYLEGTKESASTLYLDDYRGKMGTGLIDAYQLLMQIEGTPCLKVPTGELQLITLTKYFGGSAENLTYLGVEISKEDQEKLGMTAAPKMYNGQLMIKCSKPGVAHITVKAVGGGTRPGSETIVGGIEISKKFAIIARDSGAQNGGWL